METRKLATIEIIGVGMAIILGMWILFYTYSDHSARALTSGTVADYSIPSVYQVFTIVDASITYPKFKVNKDFSLSTEYTGVDSRIATLANYLQDDMDQGSSTDQASTDALQAGWKQSDIATALNVIDHQDKYTIPETYSEQYVSQSGSSFVIDERGYLATNEHVVAVTDDDVLYELSSDFINTTDTQDLFDSLGLNSDTSDYDNAYTLSTNIEDYIYNNSQIATDTPMYVLLPPSVVTSTYDSPSDMIKVGWKASLVYQGEAYPGKDIAILKLNASSSLPALSLSNSAPQVGQKVYVIGFPGVADITADLENQATFTSGLVNAIRTSDNGDFKVFQTDATIGDGSSGGPVIDDSGNVIGIVTLALEGADGQAGNFNYFLPSSLIQEALKKAGVTIGGLATTTAQYREGIDDVEKGNCAQGTAKLDGLQACLHSDFIETLTDSCKK